jgi:hypothetical protein
VRAVESAGRGFDTDGRPKRLFERHKFHRFTGGRFSPSAFSQSSAGGYSLDADGNGINDNWDKLSAAIATGEVDAAFMATSWGAFQIMGEWWDALGYASPFAMALACVASEAAHLDMLARYRAFPAQARARRAHQQPGHMPRLCRCLQWPRLPREPLRREARGKDGGMKRPACRTAPAPALLVRAPGRAGGLCGGLAGQRSHRAPA